MTPDPLSSATVRHGLGEGVALAQKAEDFGDGKAFVDWLARNPGLAAELADFLAAEQGLGRAMARLRPPPERVGAFVDEFELKEKIGEGGMGVVYRAYDSLLKREVAVKLLRNGDGLSDAEAARFRYEAEVVASLNHDNIVPIHKGGVADGAPYLVMPLMAGGSLAARLKSLGPDRQLAPEKAAEIVRAVAHGVHHAHQRGLIHRDLKPGNILLDAEGTPHVADFGLARRVDASVSTGVGIAGTVAYMAPEQGRGEKQLTTAADIYSLGVVLFELLTGGVPYGGTDIHGILLRLTDVTEPVPSVRRFRPDAPANLAAICAKCLEKRPEDRYASAQELADDLGRFLRHEEVLARPRGLFGKAREAVSRPAEVQSYVTLPFVVFGMFHHPAVHLLIMTLVLADAPPRWVFGVMMYHLVAWMGQVWWFSIRRFDELNAQERRSIVYHLATWGAVVGTVPLHLAFFGTNVMPVYPLLNAVVATGFIMTGSTFAGRQHILGLLLLSQNLLLPFLPFWAWPLMHGLTGCLVFVLFGMHVRAVHRAAQRAAAESRTPPSATPEVPR